MKGRQIIKRLIAGVTLFSMLFVNSLAYVSAEEETAAPEIVSAEVVEQADKIVGYAEATYGEGTAQLLSSVKTVTETVSLDNNEQFKMYYNVLETAKGTIKITDEEGNDIKTLYDAYEHKYGYYAAYWNLKDADGNYVTPGTYKAVLEFENASGNDSAEITFEVEGLSVYNVKADKTVIDGDAKETVTFYYQIDQSCAGSIGVYNASGEKVKTIYDNFIHAKGYYKATWNATNDSGAIVPSGTYTIRITFKNVTRELSVTVKRADLFSGLKLAQSTVDISNGEVAEMTYSVKTASQGTVTVHNSAGEEVQRLYNGDTHSVGYYRLTWNMKDTSGNYVENGTYTIRFQFVSGGSSQTETVTVTVTGNTATPQVSYLSSVKVDKSQIDLTAGEQVKLYYGVSEKIAGDIYITNESGEVVKTLYDQFTHSAGYYVAIWNGKDNSGSLVAGGTYTITLNFGGDQKQVQVVVLNEEEEEVKEKVVTSCKLESSEVNIDEKSVKLTYGIKTAASGDIRVYNASGEEVKVIYDNVAHSAGYYAAYWNGKDSSGNLVEAGQYTIVLSFGDESYELSVTITRNEVAAESTIKISSVRVDKEKVNLASDTNVKCYYGLNESAYGTIRIYDASGNIVREFYNQTSHAAGYYVITWDLKDGSGSLVPAGSYSVWMKFEKSGTASVEATVDFQCVDGFDVNYVKVNPAEAGTGRTIKLSYHPTVNSYGTIYLLDADGNVLRSWYDQTYHATGYYAITWNQKDSSGNQVDLGTYTFRLVFTNGDVEVTREIQVEIVDSVSKKIWIDAGHGGTDPGAVSNGRYEREDNLAIALEVQRVLEQQGQEVYMSRIDIDASYTATGLVSLKERVEKANAAEVDVFVSLHRDSSASLAAGFTIFTHNSTNSANNNPTAYENKNSGCTELSEAIYAELKGVGSFKARGIVYGSAAGTEDLLVNRVSNMPSCLIEMGFITNTNDNLLFDTYLKQHAKAISKGIMTYLGLTFDESLYTTS